MIPLNKPMYNKEMEEEVLRVLRDEKCVFGESVWKFEEEFAKYIGVDYAVSCSSGTMAFWLILNSLKAKEVRVPALTFHTVASVVKLQRKKLIFGDVNLEDACLHLPHGKALNIATHLYGNFCEVADYKGIDVIEDVSQAAGLTYEKRKAGSFGKAAFFSLYTTKNLSCLGDGGIITTNDEKLAENVRMVSDCGRDSKGEHVVMGITSRLNTVNAAIARVQLKYLDEWNQRRMKLRDRYKERLSPEMKALSNGVVHQMVIRVEERDKLAKYLKQNGIETGVHYRVPLHMQKPFYRKGLVLPNAEVLCEEILSLPISPSLTFDKVNYVCGKIRKWYGK